MIQRMMIADYEKIFTLWKNTDGMGLRSFVTVDSGEITGTILCGSDSYE